MRETWAYWNADNRKETVEEETENIGEGKEVTDPLKSQAWKDNHESVSVGPSVREEEGSRYDG